MRARPPRPETSGGMGAARPHRPTPRRPGRRAVARAARGADRQGPRRLISGSTVWVGWSPEAGPALFRRRRPRDPRRYAGGSPSSQEKGPRNTMIRQFVNALHTIGHQPPHFRLWRLAGLAVALLCVGLAGAPAQAQVTIPTTVTYLNVTISN